LPRQARAGGLVAAKLQPAGPDHQVRHLHFLRPGEQPGDLVGRMLAVPVDLDREIEGLPVSQPQPRLDGAADPEVAAQLQHADSLGFGDGCGRVGRVVVDHDHVDVAGEVGAGRAAFVEQRGQGLLFVVGRNDDEKSHVGGSTLCGSMHLRR
jgi:hypothetical protein